MSDRARILIVDDEEAILETMTFTFEDEYDVLSATSAREALGILDSQQPIAAVITDQRMPEMMGLDFLIESRRLRPNSSRILITAVLALPTMMLVAADGTVADRNVSITDLEQKLASLLAPAK